MQGLLILLDLVNIPIFSCAMHLLTPFIETKRKLNLNAVHEEIIEQQKKKMRACSAANQRQNQTVKDFKSFILEKMGKKLLHLCS